MLTKKILEALPAGRVFASGVAENSSNDVFMNDEGGLLRWVAVAGFAHDWCVYVGRFEQDSVDIMLHGDKLHLVSNIKNCICCDNESLSLYRH